MSKVLRHPYSRILGSIFALIILFGSVFFAFADGRLGGVQAAQPQVPSINDPVLLIHGIDGHSAANCADTWNFARYFLRGMFGQHQIHWKGSIQEIGYYLNDKNCDINLSYRHSQWYNLCFHYDNYHTGDDGTNNESIRHIACEFAWYIYDTYSKSGQNVQIVAHSMGGLIARYALYAVHAKIYPFPPMLYVHDVVTFDTPHRGGLYTYLVTGCNICYEGIQMDPGIFMNELDAHAQNPQGKAGTVWTLIGTSEKAICFPSVPAYSSLYMLSAHKIFYETPCYPHYTGPKSFRPDMMHDVTTLSNATVSYCDNCLESESQYFWDSWSRTTTFPHTLQYMLDILYYNSVTPTPSPSPSPSTWSIISSPNTLDGCNNYLMATSASSANDVWAVGNEDCSNPVMLIEHWDGTQWSIFSNPPLPTGSTSELLAVSAQSATNVWVQGSVSVPGQAAFDFVASWNGFNWTVVPTPTQICPNLCGFYGIKALSANNVWVVGEYLDQNTNIWKTMIANWNGTQWNIAPSPNAGTLSDSYNSLEAVTATSATDIWAVGYYQVSSQSNPMYTLVEHWNGTQWSIVPSPTPTSSNCNSSDCTDLVSVTATSSTDAWAISYGFVEHWDGTQWTIVFTSSTANSDLMGVAASSSNDVWVAGSLYNASQNRNLPLVEHWNGTQWNAISTPPPPIQGSAYLDGVTALSASTVWVVGSNIGRTLTELYN